MKRGRRAAGMIIILGLMGCFGFGRAEFTLPAGLTEIGDEAFEGCGAMNEASVPGGVVSIGEDAFSGCGEALLIVTEAGSEAVNYARGHQVDYRAGTTYRALLIGQNYPGATMVAPLVGPANDIAAMEARLRQLGWTVSTKRNLTADGIRAAIGTAFQGATENDVSLFYYSGHGFRNGSLVGNDIEEVSPASLRSTMDRIPGRKVVIVDACYSGKLIAADGGQENEVEIEAAAGVVGGTDDGETDVAIVGGTEDHDGSEGAEEFISGFQAAFRIRLRGALNTGGYFVITAARADEECSEDYFPEYRHGPSMGVFTYYLCMGIGYNGASGQTTAMSADVNGDGAVSIQEAFAYAAANATARHAKQHAVVWPEGCRWFAPFREEK